MATQQGELALVVDLEEQMKLIARCAQADQERSLESKNFSEIEGGKHVPADGDVSVSLALLCSLLEGLFSSLVGLHKAELALGHDGRPSGLHSKVACLEKNWQAVRPLGIWNPEGWMSDSRAFLGQGEDVCGPWRKQVDGRLGDHSMTRGMWVLLMWDVLYQKKGSFSHSDL